MVLAFAGIIIYYEIKDFKVYACTVVAVICDINGIAIAKFARTCILAFGISIQIAVGA